MGAYSQGYSSGYDINGTQAAGARRTARQRESRMGLGLFCGLYRRGVAGGAPAQDVWTPAELDNLGLWLDAADPATLIEVAGRLSQWNDKSGNDNHATQPTASKRPVASGAGQAAKVTFTNSVAEPNEEHLELTSDVAAPEIFAVVSNVEQGFVSGTPTDTFIVPILGGAESTPGSTTDMQHYFAVGDEGATPAYSVSVDGGSNSVTTGDAAINGYPYLPGSGLGTNIDLDPPGGYSPFPNVEVPDVVAAKWEAETPATNLVRWVAALQNASATPAAPDTFGKYAIRELIVLPTKFNTQAERDRMVGYLAWKWGAVDKLAPGHPYKLGPPTNNLWTPANISDIYAYYDASVEGSVTEVGGKVSQLDDLSGNDNHLVQPVGSAQPVYNAAENRLEFDGVEDFLSVAVTDWVSGNADCALSFGGIVSASPSGNGPRMGGIEGPAFNLDSYGATGRFTTGDGIYTHRFQGAAAQADGTDSRDNFCAIGNYTTSVGDSTVRFSGEAKTQTFSSPSSVLNFSSSSTIYMAFISPSPTERVTHIEHMILMKRQLSVEESERIEGWWAHTFDHTDKLPANHPYKFSPPYTTLWVPTLLQPYAFYDASREDAITEVAGTVTQVDDLSGNSHDLAQPLGSAQPTYDSVNKQLVFDGVDDFLTVSVNDWVSGNADCAESYGAIVNTDPANDDSCFGGVVGPAENLDVLSSTGGRNPGDSLYTMRYFGASARTSDTDTTENFCSVDNYTTRVSDSTVRFSGEDKALSFSNGSKVAAFNSSSDIVMAANSVPSAQPVSIEHMILMKRQLTTEDAQRIEGWWAHQFNHTDKLPAAHPYKLDPPYV